MAGGKAKTSITMDMDLRQQLEDLSASTGLSMSAIVMLAVRKLQQDFGFFGLSPTYTQSAAKRDNTYTRRRPRREMEKQSA